MVEDHDGYSDWKRTDSEPSNLVNFVEHQDAQSRRIQMRKSHEWIMDAGIYDADTMVARALKALGYNIEIKREVRGRPTDNDTARIFGSDADARETFWRIAAAPQIAEVSSADPKVGEGMDRHQMLEMVTGVVYTVTKKAS